MIDLHLVTDFKYLNYFLKDNLSGKNDLISIRTGIYF